MIGYGMSTTNKEERAWGPPPEKCLQFEAKRWGFRPSDEHPKCIPKVQVVQLALKNIVSIMTFA